ncbi:thiamine phosphate synthase [Alloacidobacterium dinghuense]|uniref:Thiamine-phosphate synthase n=1 Tax=Alloacidobacterium dinghuense TaxID=2763107 RepID=A0A7G8BQ11_9BACT|nr:thiamine phosphate synthase [Alloacidobacterium dinghuense]QNI34631.1 thiamine phosphate synthase [Alloacidobacterium dinghuense]
MALSLPPLYPILDASFLPDFERGAYLMRVVCELEEAGVTLLQYRNKHSVEEIPHDALIMRGGATSAVRLIMNDHPELAVDAGFNGVHVGQTDVAPLEARKVVGPERIVGVSTHNRAQLEAADKMPVDYIAFGPVFTTASKANPDPVVGLDGVSEVRSLTKKPLVAIGGITLENARSVLDAGANSVAVISAIFGPGKDSAKIAKDFLRIFR